MGRYNKFLKYRNLLLWSVICFVILIVLVFFFTKTDKINDQPSNSRNERLHISDTITQTSDTASIGKATDTIIKPAKNIRQQKKSIHSKKVISPTVVDTMPKSKAKNGFIRRRSGSTYEKNTADKDSLQ